MRLVVAFVTLSCLALSVAGTSPLIAQSPALRAEVGLVQVPVVVCDEDGQPVHGLPDDAFDVFENGRRMTLVDVRHVQRGAEDAGYTPRELVIVLDDSSIRPEVMPRAAQAARDLLGRLDPRDRVALVNTSTLPDVRVEFTTSRIALERATARVRGQRDGAQAFGWQRSRHGLAVIASLLDHLREVAHGDRRSTLVLFSEGYDIEAAAQRGLVDPDILRGVRAVVGRAALANVAIYAIDPAGLQPGASVTQTTGTRPVGPAGRLRHAGVSSSLKAIDDLSALAALAHDTGGRLTRSTNDLLAQVPAMLADMDDYYLLSYEMPEASARDRRGNVPAVRQIDVRVRRAGLDVRARQAYIHPSALGGV